MPNWSSNTLIGKADPSNPESEDIATPPADDCARVTEVVLRKSLDALAAREGGAS